MTQNQIISCLEAVDVKEWLCKTLLKRPPFITNIDNFHKSVSVLKMGPIWNIILSKEMLQMLNTVIRFANLQY